MRTDEEYIITKCKKSYFFKIENSVLNGCKIKIESSSNMQESPDSQSNEWVNRGKVYAFFKIGFISKYRRS